VLNNFVCEGETLLADTYVDSRLSVLKQIMICVSGIFIMLTLTILATLGYKRHSRITKAAGLAFALCFLVGCLLNYVSVFFWAISPELDVYCQARYAFVMLGYSLILGAMFSKSWEVNKVFSAGESGVANPFQEVPWWQFCRVFFTIVALQGVLLLILMVSDAPFSVSINIDAINFQSIHECHVRRPQVWIGLEAAYFVLLLVWGAYLAYETRDVWLKYNYPNESRSILLSIYNLAFCCIILVPLITTLEVSYETLFFLVSIAILWPTSFALSSVYMPKLAKFLGSSFRGSGGNSKGQSSDNSVARSASVGSGKPLVEVGPEKKLLSGDRPEKIHSKRKSKERSEETEIGRSPSPDSPLRERPIDFMVPGAVTSGDFSPSDHHRGIDRTESADLESSAPNWRGLLQSPSLPDLTESPVAST
jgi:gamma-aminobutyric acid type B receptor